MQSRLHWHCHFMQKLEDEPAIEFHNMLRAADGLRENEISPDRLAAWQSGHTGYPLVDACMRSLVATGWLTFRMRAIVVSFTSYSLWLHWRPTGLHLARHFLDFEPGIHWSQLQMQSGTTGINTLRIYKPTKQLIDRDYPPPIVDHALAVRAAKRRLAAVRGTAESRSEAQDVARRHGSRRDRRGAMQQDPVRRSLARGAMSETAGRPRAPDPQQLLPFLAPDGEAPS